jgi:hypothetical protein
MEAYVNGVSTRKVDRLVEQLGIQGMDKDRVSRLCSELDEHVEAFRTGPLEGAYPYLWVDAKQLKGARSRPCGFQGAGHRLRGPRERPARGDRHRPGRGRVRGVLDGVPALAQGPRPGRRAARGLRPPRGAEDRDRSRPGLPVAALCRAFRQGDASALPAHAARAGVGRTARGVQRRQPSEPLSATAHADDAVAPGATRSRRDARTPRRWPRQLAPRSDHGPSAPASADATEIDLPDVVWVSVGDGTRPPGDLEDQAARYDAARHELTINADFRAITDMTSHWTRRYRGTPGARPVVRAQVREWFEQTLVEVVLCARSSHWDAEQLAALLCPSALSAAVLPRQLLYATLNKRLGQKLGTAPEMPGLPPRPSRTAHLVETPAESRRARRT